MKSLEVSEEKANQRVEEFKRQLKALTVKLKEAENRAEYAEKTVKKLQKEVDRLEGKYFAFNLSFLEIEKIAAVSRIETYDEFRSFGRNRSVERLLIKAWIFKTSTN